MCTLLIKIQIQFVMIIGVYTYFVNNFSTLKSNLTEQYACNIVLRHLFSYTTLKRTSSQLENACNYTEFCWRPSSYTYLNCPCSDHLTQKVGSTNSLSLSCKTGLSNSYRMGCPPVRGDNPRALASGLSYVQVDKHGLTILYHLHQCRPCTSRDISCKSW